MKKIFIIITMLLLGTGLNAQVSEEVRKSVDSRPDPNVVLNAESQKDVESKIHTNIFIFPSDEEVEKMCLELSKNPNSFEKSKIISDVFDINNDGFKEKIVSRFSGQMQNPLIKYKLLNGEDVHAKENFDWDGNKYISHFKRKDKVYTYNFDVINKLIKPVRLSIITPDNLEYSLCHFKNKINKSLKANHESQDSFKLCDVVQNNDLTEINYIKLDTKPKMTITEYKAIGNHHAKILYQGLVDYDNDGIENILLEQMYSNYGGTLEINYFNELTTDEKGFKKIQEGYLLMKIQDDGTPRKLSEFNRFFKYEDKIYYEHITRKDHQVLMIVDQKIKKICSQIVNIDTEFKLTNESKN